MLHGKAEWLNPGGSVGTGPPGASSAAEASGALGGGRRLLDATSGNTGIAYAWIGATRGVAVTLCVPANANLERQRLLSALGAELVLTDAMDGTDGAIRAARRLAAEDPDRYHYADQYSHPANWRARSRDGGRGSGTRPAGVTHLVAGIGTSGAGAAPRGACASAIPRSP